MTLEQQITKALEGDLTNLTEADRHALLQASYRLTDAIEQPFEKVFRMLFTIYDPITIRIALDLGLIDITLAHGGKITMSKLADESKADINLVQRIVRMLVPLGVMVYDDKGEYSLTPFAGALVEGSPLKEVMIHITHFYSAISRMPEYFAAHEYQNPVDALDAPFNFAFDCKNKNYFEYLATPGNERLAKAFDVTMEIKKVKRVLLVDVGGSLGHQIRKFQETFPKMTGTYILEDLPEVVARATSLPPSTTKIGHDFFMPQPDDVKHAKAFYLRSVLHDWPEMQARKILSHIVEAMADDSVVLIHEVIMPETGVSRVDATMDWHMMALGALERTEKQWVSLADSVGLKVNGIWKDAEEDMGTKGLIELAKSK